ncbi:ROK family protein [Pseudonocardia sp. GCM10023141]|uniref:ROK family protein n=1 Tax=Pseudonocardia sp. GCM10023141 TaxID=3252653 RepID=UPI00360E8BB2
MGDPTLGIDVGGTKIASGLVDAAGGLVEFRREALAGPGERAVTQVVAIARTYLRHHRAATVGVALPGGIDPATRAVVAAPNLGWTHLALVERLRAELGREVVVENDGNAAAWAEHRFGAGAGSASTVLVAVGTGIGGGLVLDRRLHVGDRGFGGELGHLLLVPGGRQCVCGASGCWEQYASGSALVAEASDRGWRRDPFNGEDVLAAAGDGDPVALDVVEKLCGHLAHGLTVLGACFDIAGIVLGGGLGTDPRCVAGVQRALDRVAPSTSRMPVKVAAAWLGAAAGVIGAADLARLGAGPFRK